MNPSSISGCQAGFRNEETNALSKKKAFANPPQKATERFAGLKRRRSIKDGFPMYYKDLRICSSPFLGRRNGRLPIWAGANLNLAGLSDFYS
jgi:hypothetical protein